MIPEVNANIKNHIEKKVSFPTQILNYLDEEKDIEDDFKKYFDDLKNQTNDLKIKEILCFLKHIINYHHRSHDFFSRIEKIMIYFKDDIKNNFTEQQIFEFFIQNKRIILFLIENEFIKVDDSNIEFLKQSENINYFLPEIESFYLEQPIKYDGQNQERYEKFQTKRKIGENDNIIAEMIRNDSVEQFIIYISKTNYPLDSKIQESAYETNLLLTEKVPTLIEYAAFFGSIQIIEFLKNNKVDLTPSLWTYAIHSKNADLIHLLENNNVKPENSDFDKCIIESIKCHHNDIANYLVNNKGGEKGYLEYCLQFYNFELIPNDSVNYKKYERDIEQIYRCIEINPEFVDLLFKSSYLDINMRIVFKLYFNTFFVLINPYLGAEQTC